MSVNTEQFVVITNKDKVVHETLSGSRNKTLTRYKDKWLRNFDNPTREWTRRRNLGFRVATVKLKEVTS